ncbi:uncharacterized protein LOC143428234 [Xylocopa sonorina]|uniref:uncharacterized protein LOC143428234 n=1 Tax=Xylocopa sonorina TaxID=1818115 RepID=UPI00403B139D
MAVCSNDQSALNMPRCTIFVLQLYCLLAISCCTVLHRNSYSSASMSIECNQKSSSTECATGRMQEIDDKRDQTMVRVAKMIGEERTERGVDEVQEVTGRRKRNKGYGQMLLYLLGASKLTMLYVAFNTVAAIAGKALIIGKVALAIATAIGLQKILDRKEKVTYEIIKHPYHSYEHTHSSSNDFDNHGGFEDNEWNYWKGRRNWK